MNDWQLRFGFGPQFENYAPTTAQLHYASGERASAPLHLQARRNMDYYAVWNRPLKDALRWIDEPTNQFFLETEYKSQWAFGVNVFHPKVVSPEGLADVAAQFQLTRMLLSTQVYADRVFPLLESRYGSIDARVGVGTGVYTGYARAVSADGQVKESPPSLLGANLSARASLSYSTPGDWFRISVNADATTGFMHYELFDTKVTHSVDAFKLGVTASVRFF